MKLCAFDPLATRIRLRRIEFWTSHAISATYSSFLFSSYLLFSEVPVPHSFFCQYPASSHPPCSNSLHPHLLVESWKPEVKFMFVSVDIVWLDRILRDEKGSSLCPYHVHFFNVTEVLQEYISCDLPGTLSRSVCSVAYIWWYRNVSTYVLSELIFVNRVHNIWLYLPTWNYSSWFIRLNCYRCLEREWTMTCFHTHSLLRVEGEPYRGQPLTFTLIH